MLQPHKSFARCWVLVLAAAAGCMCAAGCDSGIPRTYPVKGKVVWKGKGPVMDGRIEFRSVSDPTLAAVGEIEEDGTFVLTTFRDGKKRQGAVEGQHKVVVEPEWGDTKLTFALPTQYTVEPRDNNFTIELKPPAR